MSTEINLSRPQSSTSDLLGLGATTSQPFPRQIDTQSMIDELVSPKIQPLGAGVDVADSSSLPDTDAETIDDSLGKESFAQSVGRESKHGDGAFQTKVGKTGVERTVNTYLVLFVTLLIGALGVLGYYFMKSNLIDDMTAMANEAATESQEISVMADLALVGNARAFETIGKSRATLNSLLTRFEDLQTRAKVTASAAPFLVSAQSQWKSIETDLERIINDEDLLNEAKDVHFKALSAGPAMLASAQEIINEILKARRPSVDDVVLGGNLAVQTQRIADETALRLSPQSGLFGQPGDLLATVASIEPMLAELTAKYPGSAASADKLRLQIAGFSPSLQTVLGQSAELVALEKSDLAVRATGSGMRDSFLKASTVFPYAHDENTWLPLTSAALGLLAAFAALLASRTYMRNINARAADAQRQKEVAQELEAEAKQMNDQNQAAILRLMNELQEVADGDLTVQATVSEDITGAIADSINYTIEELRSLVSRINLTAEMVNKASSSAHVAVSQLQEVSEQQSREMKRTGESVLNMAKRINDVSNQASQSVEVARQSLSASQEGSRAVNHTISGMNMIRDQIQETSKRIKRLGESSQEIGEIVEMISDLTEQTNVLALNAAIQAASAGEAGRGFTIVAEEVQRLAERSAEATKQISSLIKTIQTDTHDAVAAMERSTQGVVDGTRRSDEAGGALKQIGTVSEQLAQLIEGFSETTSDQAESAGVVAASIQRIFQVTKQTAEGTAHTAGSVHKLSALSEELKSSVARFKVG